MKMSFDDEGLLKEPCLSCEKSYVEDIWYEWCCDEKECPHKKEQVLKSERRADENN